MPSLNQIVDIVISRQAKGITRRGFGTPLILGQHTRFAERIRFYEDLDGVAADFQTSDAEYKAASAIFSQEQKPTRIAIGRRTAAVAQVVTFTPTVANNAEYSVTINGTAHTYTSDSDATAAEIVAALISAINGGAQAGKVTASGTTTLAVTADVAGDAFTYASSANLPAVLTTPNNGAREDIAAVVAESDEWYALLLTSRTDADILNAAAEIETRKKIYIACSDASGIIASGSSDIASQLKALNYDRTALLYSEDQDAFPEAAWAGLVLPFDPGSETWKFKNLTGVEADNLTISEQTQAKNKNANTYESYAGAAIVAEGTMASGEFIDTIRFVDWLEAQLQENVFTLFLNTPKVPFTDAGIALIEKEARAQVKRGKDVGGLDPAFETIWNVPTVAQTTSADRQARTLRTITFEDRLAGAVHKVVIRGRVSV